VRRLVAKGEGQLLEFKPGNERPSELASSLAAFANADGGTLLLGIAERPGEPSVIEGVANPKLARDHLHTAAGLCNPKLELTPPEEIAVDGRVVLVVAIPGGLRQVYGADGRYVIREGSFRRPLGADELRALLSRRGLFNYDRLPAPGATRAHFDTTLVREFVDLFRSGRRMGDDALLESREMLVRPEGRPEDPLVPSVAGMLLLGTHPQQFFPQARVAVVQYAGPTMGESFLKREIEGTVQTQLDEAEAWLVRNTLHGIELRGMDRIDRDEYPREALREAVLNALAHRDYSQRGDRVRIYAFSDRVEVHSPGGLGGPMRLDNLLERRWSRNATLVQGLVAFDIIEEVGFGLDRMVAVMADAALPPPVFKEIGDTFVVTLYGADRARLLTGDRAVTPAPHDTVPHVGDAPRRRMSQEERLAWALERLRTVGDMGAREYAAAVGIDRRTAQRDLTVLVERRVIVARGTTTDRRYSLRRDVL